MVLPLIFGALAPGLFGSAMSPLLASALGAGVGGAIESGDLETGLLTGLGAFAGGSILGPMLGGGAGAAADAATQAATMGTAGANAAGAAGAAAVNPAATAAAAAANPATAPQGGLMSLFSGPAPGSTASLLGTPAAGAAGGAAGGGGMLKEAMNFAKSPTGMGVGIGSMAGPMLAPLIGGGGDDEDGKKKYKGPGGHAINAMPRQVRTPGPGFVPGQNGEFDFGIGNVPTAGEIMDFNKIKYSDGGLLRRYQQMMGPVRLAAGGIATLAETDSEQMQAPPVGGNEKDVVTEAVRAIQGQSDRPEIALAAFLKTYGEDALRELVDRVQSGEMGESEEGEAVEGPGDGMDDMIPASIEGEQDVLLSDGEFVIPADVVSGLGNGSTEAGARALDEMMARVRQARTGSSAQPPKVPREAMLPV